MAEPVRQSSPPELRFYPGPKPETAAQVAADLRPEDRKEVELATGRPAPSVCMDSVRRSDVCWAATVDGEPMALFGGVALPEAEVGVAWMLARPGAHTVPTKLWREASETGLILLLAWRPVLVNYVWAGHRRAIRWLHWLGAEIEPSAPYGRRKAAFRRFVIAAETARV